MSTAEPVSSTVAVPSPVTERPVVCDSVSLPLATVRVTVSEALSISATVIACRGRIEAEVDVLGAVTVPPAS